MARHDDSLLDPKEFLESDSATTTCGLLRKLTPLPELNLILELYLRELTGRLFQEIQSVFLFGSAALDDIAPAHGDIDILVVARRDLGEAARGEISVIHRYLASEGFAPWGRMLSVHYFALPQLKASRRSGRGLKGITGKVVRSDPSELLMIDLLSLHDHGILLFGQDIRKELKRPSLRELLGEIHSCLAKAKELHDDSDVSDYVGTCTGLVKILHTLAERHPFSKSDATRWFASTVGGKAGDVAVEANRLRRGELKTGVGGMRRLMPAFLEAIRSELSRIERDLEKEPDLPAKPADASGT